MGTNRNSKRVIFLIANLLGVGISNSPTLAQLPADAAPQEARANSASQTPSPNPTTVDCSIFLPKEAKVPADAAPTLFWFRLSIDGNMHDVSLYRTSGSDDLDKAALACANSIHGKPFKLSGNPIDITWVGAIAWKNARHNFALPDPSEKDHTCSCHGIAPGYSKNRFGGVAVVTFRIDTDGKPTNVIVRRSAGNSYFDNAAVACVSAWHYFPALRNGAPTELDSASAVRFMGY